MNSKVFAAALCAAIGLSACEREGKMAANAGLCPDFKATQAAAPMTGDAAAPVDECVRRWAYSLASSRDDA
jgi:hypothetical protein